MTPQQLHRLVGAAVFLITLVLYAKTAAPTTSFWDTGEFITTSYILGVPHPPGSPLYVLLGRLFSMVPIGEIAARVVFMSVLASAIAVWFTYGSVVTLARRAMGGHAFRSFGDSRDWSVALGAAVAALCLAVSYTFWFNGTEAEVYAYSLFFVCGGMWLIFHWEGTGHGARNDHWLLLIAYFFGLGGGLHLLCLLTVPTLVVLAWFADRDLRRLILIGVGAGLEGLVILSAFAEHPPTAGLLALGSGVAAAAIYLWVWSANPEHRRTVLFLVGAGVVVLLARAIFGGGTPVKIAFLGSAAAVLFHLYHDDRRAFGLSIGAVVLFLLGYSTYLALFIRSGLDPYIDMNNPENLENFISFLNREQYGTDSQLLGMLTARSERSYQLWHQQMKYFFQQWPFPFLERDIVFRWATERAPHIISVSLVPLIAGLAGFGWQLRRDWRRFLGLLVMFVIMGFGLSFYLNMPDPQPRERHYVFGGMFLAWAVWMGLGWSAGVEWLRQRFSLNGKVVALVACLGLVLPLGTGAKLYHEMDRTGDYIAYDYAYNLLQSCDENALLFTNGDNDTFPLWFLQEVEGIRRDVRVVNLSLLNTAWYIKQLRDREPRVGMGEVMTDEYIEEVLTDTQMVDLVKRLWREPRRPREYVHLGIDSKVSALPGHDLLRIQDIMAIGIAYWNAWERPIHFALTVASSNRVGLDPHLEFQGMTLKLVPYRVDARGDSVRSIEERMQATDRLAHNLMSVYRFRGVADDDVYKDLNTRRLLQNYRACVMTLAGKYQEEGRVDELAELLRWAETTIPMGWEGYYAASQQYEEIGRNHMAVEFLVKAADGLVAQYGDHPSATYENGLALASILLNNHRAYTEAEAAYRRVIALRPEVYGGVHELAATLQAAGRTQDALREVENWIAEYGESDPDAVHDRDVLRNALQGAASGSGLLE
jgi:tetratricopeptide (TPR) repeat protein